MRGWGTWISSNDQRLQFYAHFCVFRWSWVSLLTCVSFTGPLVSSDDPFKPSLQLCYKSYQTSSTFLFIYLYGCTATQQVNRDFYNKICFESSSLKTPQQINKNCQLSQSAPELHLESPHLGQEACRGNCPESLPCIIISRWGLFIWTL